METCNTKIMFKYLKFDESTGRNEIKKIELPVKIFEKSLSRVYVTWESHRDIDLLNKPRMHDVAVIDFGDDIGEQICFKKQLDDAMSKFNGVDHLHINRYEAKKILVDLIKKSDRPQ